MSASDTRGGLLFYSDGPTSPDAADIRQRVAAIFQRIWGVNLDITSRTPQGQLIDAITAVIFDKNSQLLHLSNMWNPETNEGKWQDDVGKIYFINRRLGTPTVVNCDCMGRVGLVIPAGSIAVNEVGVQFYAAGDITIPAGGIATNQQFICSQPGPIPCPQNSLNRIFQRVNGWDTINNPEDGVLGNLDESRLAFERRRYDSVSKNAHGNVSAVFGDVSNVNGVISVRIAENRTNMNSDDFRFIEKYGTPWPGIVVHGHSMFISVLGGYDMDIAQAIWRRIDGGCGQDGNTTVIVRNPTEAGADILETPITFNRPSSVQGYVQIMIKKHDDIEGDIEAQIQQAVVDAWNGVSGSSRVGIGDTVFGLQFACPVNQLSGFDLIEIKVARDSAMDFSTSFSTTLNEIAVISKSNVFVIGI